MYERDILIEDLNRLLKGTHMGAFVFQDLRSKMKDEKHLLVFDSIIKKLRRHEASLTEYITELGGNPVDTAGLKGTFAELMCKLKDMTLFNDKDTICEAIKSIKTGNKALCDFNDQHAMLSKSMADEVKMMKNDYESIHHSLKAILVNYDK